MTDGNPPQLHQCLLNTASTTVKRMQTPPGGEYMQYLLTHIQYALY